MRIMTMSIQAISINVMRAKWTRKRQVVNNHGDIAGLLPSCWMKRGGYQKGNLDTLIIVLQRLSIIA
jgi:hypothetical protein